MSQHVLINAAAEAQKRLQQQLLNGGSVIGDRGVSGGAGAKSGIGSGPVGPSGLTAAEEAAVDNLRFLPQEIEGQIFFEGQAVAVLPVYPMQVHPLMDDTIFKIMLSVPTLQVVLVLPDSFFSHTRDLRHRMSWARKLASEAAVGQGRRRGSANLPLASAARRHTAAATASSSGHAVGSFSLWKLFSNARSCSQCRHASGDYAEWSRAQDPPKGMID